MNGFSEIIKAKFERAVQLYNMLDNVHSVLVAFSGGADSAALLHFFSKLDISVYAVHVNHLIRGEEAYRDQHFCEDLCQKLGIKLFVETADVPKLAAQNSKTLEEAARDVRYEAFARLKKLHAFDKVATAHNSGDNLETVIFNITRGAGIKGVSGIPPVRDYLIRPFIYCSKTEIQGYCNENNLGFVTDSTNFDTDYTRNFIRCEILPKLAEINPSCETSVCRLCDIMRRDQCYIENEAAKILIDTPRSLLKELPDALLSRFIIRLHGGSLGFEHIEAVSEMIRFGHDHQSLSLPGNIKFIMENGRVYFKSTDSLKPPVKFRFELTLGDNVIPDLNAHIIISHTAMCEKDINQLKNIYKLFIHTTVSSDRIVCSLSLYIRSRENGDKYVYGGLRHSVKKLLSDRKIPLDIRNEIPFFCDNNGIFWIPGFPVSDDMKVIGDFFHIYYFKGMK